MQIQVILILKMRFLYTGQKLGTEDLKGKVYLEMWCSFKGKGQFFSKAIENALTGTNNWTVQEAPFFLKKGEKSG